MLREVTFFGLTFLLSKRIFNTTELPSEMEAFSNNLLVSAHSVANVLNYRLVQVGLQRQHRASELMLKFYDPLVEFGSTRNQYLLIAPQIHSLKQPPLKITLNFLLCLKLDQKHFQ